MSDQERMINFFLKYLLLKQKKPHGFKGREAFPTFKVINIL